MDMLSIYNFRGVPQVACCSLHLRYSFRYRVSIVQSIAESKEQSVFPSCQVHFLSSKPKALHGCD